MSRSRDSAKRAGARFERQVADYLSRALGDDGIDRQVKTGALDTGDIRGVLMRGGRVVVECKDYAGRHELPQWLREAEAERGTRDAAYAVVAWKRRGVSDPAEQYVTMTMRTFAAMLAGGPELLEEDNG